MTAKEKLVGIILIIVGALPLLLLVKNISDIFTNSKILNIFTPGEILYQVIIILLGVLLLSRLNRRYY